MYSGKRGIYDCDGEVCAIAGRTEKSPLGDRKKITAGDAAICAKCGRFPAYYKIWTLKKHPNML